MSNSSRHSSKKKTFPFLTWVCSQIISKDSDWWHVELSLFMKNSFLVSKNSALVTSKNEACSSYLCQYIIMFSQFLFSKIYPIEWIICFKFNHSLVCIFVFFFLFSHFPLKSSILLSTPKLKINPKNCYPNS